MPVESFEDRTQHESKVNNRDPMGPRCAVIEVTSGLISLLKVGEKIATATDVCTSNHPPGADKRSIPISGSTTDQSDNWKSSHSTGSRSGTKEFVE